MEKKELTNLFHQHFDKEDYSLKELHHTEHSSEFAIIDNIEGVVLIFSITNNYNIFNIYTKGAFLAITGIVKDWLYFLHTINEKRMGLLHE